MTDTDEPDPTTMTIRESIGYYAQEMTRYADKARTSWEAGNLRDTLANVIDTHISAAELLSAMLSIMDVSEAPEDESDADL